MAEDAIDPSVAGLENLLSTDTITLNSEALGNVGEVKINDPHIQFERDSFLKVIGPAVTRAGCGGDIVSKNLLLEIGNEDVQVFSSDGLTFYCGTVKCKTQGALPKEAILDVQTLIKVARTQQKNVCLIWKEDQWAMEFFGGAIVIPTIRMDSKNFKSKVDFSEAQTEVIDPVILTAIISSLKGIPTKVDIPELSYLFMEKDGCYVCNGVTVAKYKASAPGFSIKAKDLPVIESIVSAGTASVKLQKLVKEGLGVVRVQVDGGFYEMPFNSITLASQFKTLLRSDVKGHYISPLTICKILSLFNSLPDCTGLIEIKVDGPVSLNFLSKRNIKSRPFILAPDSAEGANKVIVKARIGNLINVFNVFKKEQTVKIAIEKNRMLVISDNEIASTEVLL